MAIHCSMSWGFKFTSHGAPVMSLVLARDLSSWPAPYTVMFDATDGKGTVAFWDRLPDLL
jgi:hypothetical protein